MLFDEMNTDAALVPVFACPLRIASASPTPFDQDSMSPWFTQSTHSVDTSASAQPSSMRVQVPPLGNDPQRRKSSSTSGSPRGAGMCRTPLGLQLGTPDLSRRSSVASSAAPLPLQSHISMVVPDHLYISSYRGASNAETVRQQHIGAFLCVAAEITSLPAHVDPFKVATGDIGFRHLRVEDDASCNVAAHLETAFAFIDEQNAVGRSVLLYCKAGKSRSATIAVAYLMREFGLSTLDALRTLQAVHPEADPNIFFLEQLKRWDEVRAR